MLKTKLRRLLVLPIMLLIILALAACGTIEAPSGGGNSGGNKPNSDKNKPTGGENQLASVSVSSITFTETSFSLIVQWDAVPNATSYELRISKSGSSSVRVLTVEEPTIDLKQLNNFVLPENGSITISFTAKASGYTDSEAVTKTYEMEGALLLSPEIISFNNGVIEWKRITDASSYTVKVNGTASVVNTNTYNVSSLSGTSLIEISATINGKAGAATAVMYDASTKKLSVTPIKDYTLEGDILKWDEVGGATGYKVVDLDFNSYVVTNPHYIMDIRNIVYGVYPVMAATSVVESAEIVPVDIKYLEGQGTAASPYLIKTPFDLRTIDYYELKYAETRSTSKNYYQIVNDIDYNTVSALEGESNMYTLRKPFFGNLDGGSKTLSNIEVHYQYGFWALFEFIAAGGIVKNINFDNAKLNNTVQDETHPINPATAMLAYYNYGIVSSIKLENSTITVKGGNAAGLVIHNYGTVSGCTVNKCDLIQSKTSDIGSAAYEMAGVVLENCKGGRVESNNVTTLNITGSGTNVGSAAGVVAINRASATVNNNSFNAVVIKNQKSGKEAGGVVGYCATGGTVTKGTATLGTLTVGANNVTTETGNATTPRGKLYGKRG